MKARAYLQDDVIEVRFVGDDLIVKQNARAVRGGRRVRGQLAWRYPLTVDVCRGMRAAWGDALKVHQDLSAWYRQAAEVHREQAERAKARVASLTVLPGQYPELHAWLKPDQRVAAEWIANAYRNGGLLADEGGVGKTAAIIAGLLERKVQGNILVICPKVSVRSVWGKHFEDLSDIPCYVARGTRARREKAIAAFQADDGPRKALVIVAEMLRVKGKKDENKRLVVTGSEYPELFGIKWSTVIVDEGHRLLGSLDVVKGNLAGEGLCRLQYGDDTFRLCATATPWGKGGRVEALFGTLHWLWPDEFPSKWQWINRHFEVEDKEVRVRGGRGATITVKRIGGLKKGGERDLYDSLGPRVLRRTMAEVSPAHKGLKNWIEMSCEMDSRQERLYRDFVDNAEVKVEGGILSTTGTLDYFTRCRQLANGVVRMVDGKVKFTGESNKVDRLIDHLEAIGVIGGQSSTKVVVASQYNEFLQIVKDRLQKAGCEYLELTGATTEAKREQAMEVFQNGYTTAHTGPIRKCPECSVLRNQWHLDDCSIGWDPGPLVFLLNAKAGGVSITLDAADEMHQLDEMYPPEANEQLHWRIFRRGRVHEVFYYLYRSEGTIDEQVGFNVAEGTAAQLRVLDGRRGISYVRELAKYRPRLMRDE